MADNSSLPVASGNEIFANDDIAGVKYPRPKINWGPDGTANDVDVAANKMLPTQLRHSDGTILSDSTGIKISATQLDGSEYETVAASQTAQVLGATGATGDFISGILVVPATTSPGVVTLLDNAISIPVFVGGATSVSNLVPFFIPLGIFSVSGAWKITTGANVSCIGIGNFT